MWRRTVSKGNEILLFKKDSKATAPIKSVGWKFTDVFKLDDDIIQGNIVKVTTKQSLIFSDNHADATKVEYKDDLTAVKFLYSISKEIFAYKSSTEIPYQDTPQKIEKIFKINDTANYIGDIKVMLKTQTNNITTKLTSGIVKKFEMDFIIPNDKKTTDSIADLLTSNGIKTASLKGENADGIDSIDDAGKLKGIVKEIVELMNKGYAKATFWMSADKNTKKQTKITSKTMAQKKNIDGNDINDVKSKLV